MVFDDEFFTVPFMREGTIPPNWTDILQRISQSGAPDNIDLEENWFNPIPEEDTRKTPGYKPIIAPKDNNTLKSLHYVPHTQ